MKFSDYIIIYILSVVMFAMIAGAFVSPIVAASTGYSYEESFRFLLILSLIGGIFVALKSKD